MEQKFSVKENEFLNSQLETLWRICSLTHGKNGFFHRCDSAYDIEGFDETLVQRSFLETSFFNTAILFRTDQSKTGWVGL